jgi:transcriptional regulator with XRE-family HTH domain
MMSTAPSALFWNERLQETEPGGARAALGGRLRAVRQQRLGLTLAEFGRRVAEAAGRRRAFSNVTVANWESGRQEPNFATLQAIAHLAHLPLCFFAGIGELDEFPRVNWFTTLKHGNDAQLRRLGDELQQLSDSRRRLVFAAIAGLLEGLEQEQARAARANGVHDAAV